MYGQAESNKNVGYVVGALSQQELGAMKQQIQPARGKNKIEVSLDALSAQISNAEQAVQIIAERLKPIRSQGPAADNAVNATPQPGPSCELDARLQHLSHRASVVTDALNILMSELCI